MNLDTIATLAAEILEASKKEEKNPKLRLIGQENLFYMKPKENIALSFDFIDFCMHNRGSKSLNFAPLELLKFSREVSLSFDYHRYGNTQSRTINSRSP